VSSGINVLVLEIDEWLRAWLAGFANAEAAARGNTGFNPIHAGGRDRWLEDQHRLDRGACFRCLHCLVDLVEAEFCD
jgi:hypothetical protein